ncbi:Uncharacterized protein APZ42_004261, partial [Daphnia magna]
AQRRYKAAQDRNTRTTFRNDVIKTKLTFLAFKIPCNSMVCIVQLVVFHIREPGKMHP